MILFCVTFLHLTSDIYCTKDTGKWGNFISLNCHFQSKGNDEIMNVASERWRLHSSLCSRSSYSLVTLGLSSQYKLSGFHFYRPQTKFAKVMFSQMSVCPRGSLSGRSPTRMVKSGRYASYWNAFLLPHGFSQESIGRWDRCLFCGTHTAHLSLWY